MIRYKSIIEPKEVKLNIERSEFIGNVQKVDTSESAQEFIKEISQKYINATHNCWAYKVYENEREIFNYSDNGEPSGTAGKPIFGVIEKYGLSNIAIVVTRYFGGVKLGIRGLIDAYSSTAEEAVKKSKVVNYHKTSIYEVECDYSQFSEIERLTRKIYDFKIIDQNFGVDVHFTFEIPEENKAKILKIFENKVNKIKFLLSGESFIDNNHS